MDIEPRLRTVVGYRHLEELRDVKGGVKVYQVAV
jgi:hypothetical protein